MGYGTRGGLMIPVMQVFTSSLSLTFATGLPAVLRERGYALTVVASGEEKLREFCEQQGCDGINIEMKRGISPRNDLGPTAELIRVLRERRPEIVHVSTPKASLLGLIAATAAGTHHRLYQIRGSVLETATGRMRTLLKGVERTCCTLATAVLCQSDSLRRSLVAQQLASPERLFVALSGSNGVDAQTRFNPERIPPADTARLRKELNIADGATVVLFVGRLVGDKGVGELHRAWEAIARSHPDAVLVLVGPFEERDGVTPETRQFLESESTVRLVGVDWEVAPYYALADLLVLPTYREGFPNVLLEAGAMRLPVVATRVDGCVDAVVDGSTGTLVAARDAQALQQAIVRYLDEPELRQRHGAAARTRVIERFDRRVMQHAIADIYDHLLGRPRHKDAVLDPSLLAAWSTGGPLKQLTSPRLHRFRS